MIGEQDRSNDGENRERRCLHAYREAVDDVGAVPRSRSLCDVAHVAVLGCRVVFGDKDDRCGNDEANERAVEEIEDRIEAVAFHEERRKGIERGSRENTCDNEPFVQGAHNAA